MKSQGILFLPEGGHPELAAHALLKNRFTEDEKCHNLMSWLINLHLMIWCIFIDESQLKKMKFVVKEGAKYRLMLTFNVQREIVSGFRFINKITRKGLPGRKKI